jgi:Stage II sporulation protein E (SpoIIE)
LVTSRQKQWLDQVGSVLESLDQGVIVSGEDRPLPTCVIHTGDYGLVIPGDGRLDVIVCDVSGHGISSALVTNRIYSETMSQIERGADLGSMLRHLNHFAVQHLASSSFYFTLAAV